MKLPALILALLSACTAAQSDHGIPNFRVVDVGVYRGGQPSTLGWQYLHDALGVRTVVKLDLESEGSDVEAIGLGMDVIDASGPPAYLTDFFGTPSAAHQKLAIDTLLDPARRPVYVHCLHGQDRTGYTVGKYRVLADRYTKDAAYQEMLSIGFHPEFTGLLDAWEDFNAGN